jgi:hypothetical protein
MHFFNHQTHHRGQAHCLLTGLTGTAPVARPPRLPARDRHRANVNLWLRLLHLIVASSSGRGSIRRATCRGSPSGSGRTTSTPRCT